MTVNGRGPNAATAAATAAPRVDGDVRTARGRGGCAEAAARRVGRAPPQQQRGDRQRAVGDRDHDGRGTTDDDARESDRELGRAQGAQRAAGAGQPERARRGTRVRGVAQLAGTGHREQRARGEERPAREGRDVVRAQTGPPHMRDSEAQLRPPGSRTR